MTKPDNIEMIYQLIGEKHDVFCFLHNTIDEKTAIKIATEGFKYEGYMEYTTDQVAPGEMIELRYFMHSRGKYGHYTMIIQIGKNLVEKYSLLLINTKYHFSMGLSIATEISSEDEIIYQLNPQFIKGFFDHSNSRIWLNPLFAPYTDLPEFSINTKRILESNG